MDASQTRWVVPLDELASSPIRMTESEIRKLPAGSHKTLLEGRDFNTRNRMPEGWQIRIQEEPAVRREQGR